MKTKILFLFLIGLANSVFSQSENYIIAFTKFEANFNAEKYDEIFNDFSSEMKAHLPLENTKQFLSSVNAQVGKIISMEFINDQSESGVLYKTQFERAVLGVYISLDNQNKIAGLLIKRFEESMLVESASINALTEYPKTISEIIFSASKKMPNNTQLSIAIIRNGKTDYYGIIRDEKVIKPIENQNKVFEIGSITKVFTATVLAALVEEEKIKLNDEINSFYPFNFNDNIKITFESLANHTSGLARLPENLDLSNISNPYKDYGKSEIEEYLQKHLKLENNSLKTYAYSNLGTGLLGYTLGVSQNTTFQLLLQQRVFNKYNMINSFTSSQNIKNKLVKGLDKNGKMVSSWDFDALFGAGGILSTAEDLAKFAIAHFNSINMELDLTRNSTFDINENLKIGLGWYILISENKNNIFWHNGGTGGYSSIMVINIKSKSAVIVLSNVSDINGVIDKLGFELLKENEK